MKYSVLVHKEKDGYSVTVPGLPHCQSHAPTEEEALTKISLEIAETLRRTKTVEVEVSSPNGSAHPWKTFAGIWQNDPSFNGFLAEIEAARRQDETDAETPGEHACHIKV